MQDEANAPVDPADRIAARRYLRNKRCVLWADWDLTSPESFHKAVEWLAQQYANVRRHSHLLSSTRVDL